MSLPEHSIAAPSSAPRHVQCPGAMMAEAQNPELPTDDPSGPEGTAAHWVGAEWLTTGAIAQPGQFAPNGVMLTEEMIDGAELWVDDVLKVCRESATDTKYLQVEQPIKIPNAHPEHGYGTPDTVLWTPGIHLYVWDFKFGHRPIDPYENWQLLDYVSGHLDAKPDIEWSRVTVHMRIVQPRCYSEPRKIREWVINADDLRAYRNIRRSTVEEAFGLNPRFVPGEECLDCRARHQCKALQATVPAIMDHVTRERPMDLTPEAIGWEFRAAERALVLLKAYHSGLEEQAKHRMRGGERLPGVMFKQGAGKKVWSVPAATAIGLARTMGVDIAKSVDAITPTQAEKKGLNAALLKGLTKDIPGGLSVAIDDGSLTRRLGFGKS